MDIDANDVSVSSDTQESTSTGDILKLLNDVQELQPLDFPETDQEPNNEIQNDIESESSLGSDSDTENNYVIEIEEQGCNLERTPCTQYQHDVDLDCDVNSGWLRLEQNTGPPVIHDCQGACKTYLDIDMQTAMPSEYFDQFFENKMWTIISENTNSYIQEKLASGNKGNLIEMLVEGLDTNENVRLSDWRDTTPGEMKVVIAHIIVFGILKKASFEQYWSSDFVLNMPFFSRYMSRNQFQSILWNLHVSGPKKKNPSKGHTDHDALFLVRPMIEMMQRKFATNYCPHTQISLDESTIPFKGRVGFKCYNPKKPNRVHIKMFMVS